MCLSKKRKRISEFWPSECSADHCRDVLVIVLLGWILRELPTAIDHEFGIVPTTEGAPVQVYHPSTHVLILSGKWRAALSPCPLGNVTRPPERS